MKIYKRYDDFVMNENDDLISNNSSLEENPEIRGYRSPELK